MTEPISTAASAVGILDRIAAAFRWAKTGPGKKESTPRLRPQAYPFEIRPIQFDINLTQSIPTIEISLVAINYRQKAMTLRELKVSQINLSGGPVLEQIYLWHEVQLDARSSFIVYCRRNLKDSEVRVIQTQLKHQWCSASVALVARAGRGRKVYEYGPVAAQSIEGRINHPVFHVPRAMEPA